MSEVLSEQVNQTLSFKEVSGMFDTLFLNPDNLEMTARLFEGIPGMTRAQRVQEVIKTSRSEIEGLKSSV